MDKRAGELNAEYLAKKKRTDQTYCGTPQDTVGPVELKLGSLGRVHGIVVGAFGEASDDLHSLIHHLAVSRVRFAGPQVGRRGQVRTEEAEIALTTFFLRKSLSVCAAKQRFSWGGWTSSDQVQRPPPLGGTMLSISKDDFESTTS